MRGGLNFGHYLPSTEQRIKRLRRIIDGRPVAIILHGFSCYELEERIGELKDCDICYCSVSRFWVIEEHILSKIGQALSLVMCSAEPGAQKEHIVRFLARDEENMMVSTPRLLEEWGVSLESEFFQRYDRKLLFHDTIWGPGYELFTKVPNKEYPLHFPCLASLAALLSLALIGGAKMVAIFGADGGQVSPSGLYYRAAELGHCASEGELMFDTNQFNEFMPGLLERVNETYGLTEVDIINCSLESHYSPFPRLSYRETFSLLKARDE